MSNKIIHFFFSLVLSFNRKNASPSLARISFCNLLSFISRSGCYGSAKFEEQSSILPLTSIAFTSISRTYFPPIIQPPPSHITRDVLFWAPNTNIGVSNWEIEKCVLTYFQMKYNIFPQFTFEATCFKLFSGAPQNSVNPRREKSMILNTWKVFIAQFVHMVDDRREIVHPLDAGKF